MESERSSLPVTGVLVVGILSGVCFFLLNEPSGNSITSSQMGAEHNSVHFSSQKLDDLPAQKAPDRSNAQKRKPESTGSTSFLSPHARPICLAGQYVYAVNTPADTVDVIDRESHQIVRRIRVGIDPVSLAVRPDGKELWVSNHVSDSINVISLDPTKPTHHQVIATIQDFDDRKATRFDEPVSIAFANNQKAYVALSSENQIAVIDVQKRKVTHRLKIAAQDPRDIVVRNGKLYVIPFESNNQTQLSGGSKIDGDLVTFNAWEHSIRVNNVLSIGHVVDIVKNPKVPDRDLFVFDTKTDKLIHTVDTLGTLLYGIAVDSQGQIYISQTDARNDVNGRSGTKKHSLTELQNRAFLNQITKVKFDKEQKDPEVTRYDLEPLPPAKFARDQALATPFAVEVSSDNKLLYATAASSNQFFTFDLESGAVLDRADVDAVPRGIVIESANDSKTKLAWVFNAVANSVSVLDVSDPAKLSQKETIVLEDPTPEKFKRGRIAFNNALASSTGTFSCASCHPDGHTDQLLWVLKTPVVTGGNQIMPRSTMPLRGLQDTAPFHWDGIPGDPYGGNNSANVYASVEPNAKVDQPESTTRHLIDGGLASTMLLDGDPTTNDEKKSGYLSSTEREDMAKFLLHIAFPPAQRRAYDDQLSERARKGFELFHVIGDVGGTPGGNLCGNCHRMPFLVSTNTPGTGMDAPTWRGAYDRFLILPQGRLNIIDFPFYASVAERGIPEKNVWQFSWGGRKAFDPVWDMVLESSTGYSGALGRQVTLRQDNVKDAESIELLTSLEKSARDGSIILEAQIATLEQTNQTVSLQFDGQSYFGNGEVASREELLQGCMDGKHLVTFTARHGVHDSQRNFQPGIWTLAPIHAQSGRQQFPILEPESKIMKLNGRHIRSGANIHVDGSRVNGSVQMEKGDQISVTLEKLPKPGMHFLQIQNRAGLFSNEFIFYVAQDRSDAKKLAERLYPEQLQKKFFGSLVANDLESVRIGLESGANINQLNPESGMTPLATACYYGHVELAEFLVEKGARLNKSNRDGNTPLILAAFMCHDRICKILVEKGASLTKQNRRGESPIDVVSGKWTQDLANLYLGISRDPRIDLDLNEVKKGRERVGKLLRSMASKK